MRTKQRQSNIELARIIAMFLITAFHCIQHSGALSHVIGFNRDYTYFWYGIGHSGVNIFLLISSYFLLEKQNTVRQFVRVWLTTLFYFILIVIVAVFLLHLPTDPESIIGSFFPVFGYQNWFVSTFCIWLLLLPIANQVLRLISSSLRHAITIALLLLECILPTFHEMHYYHHLLFFFLLYFLMAEYRAGCLNFLNSTKRCWILIVVMTAVNMTEMIGFNMMDCAVYPFYPTDLVIGFCIFSLCLNMRPFYSRTINLMGKATYGIFLLHTGNFIRKEYLWPQIFKSYRFVFSRWYPIWMPACICVLFVAGTIIDYLRVRFLETPLEDTTAYQNVVAVLEKKYDHLIGREEAALQRQDDIQSQ